MTGDTRHKTHNLLFVLYRCYYLHTLKDSVSPECVFLKAVTPKCLELLTGETEINILNAKQFKMACWILRRATLGGGLPKACIRRM